MTKTSSRLTPDTSQMPRNARIYIAGHKGLVGSAILRKLETDGYKNLITRSSNELDLTRQADVEAFFEKGEWKIGIPNKDN